MFLSAAARARPRRRTSSSRSVVGAYTVQRGDNGAALYLAGNAFFNLTFAPPNAYTPDFSCLLSNGDSWSSGRAKFISLSGGGSFLLWPGSSAHVFSEGGAWQVLRSSRQKLPTNGITFWVDPTNGSDTYGNADGLGGTGVGTSAFASTNGALAVIYNEFDWVSNNAATQVTVKLAPGATDSTIVHVADQGVVGAAGARGVTLDGNAGSYTGGVQVFFGGVVEIQNCTLSNAAGTALSATQGGLIYLQSGVTFGTTSSVHMSATEGGEIAIQASYTIAGGAAFHVLCASGARIIAEAAITVTVSANITFSSDVAFVQGPNYVDFSGVTWSLGGHTVTGTAYAVQYNAVMFGASSVPHTVAGSTSAGGQIT